MRKSFGTTGNQERHAALRRVLRRILGGGAVAAALAAFPLSPASAQTSTSPSQFVVNDSVSVYSISDEISSIVFNNDYTLTLIDGQVLRPVLLSRTSGAELVLGNGTQSYQVWTMMNNSPSWTGAIRVLDTNSLILDSGVSNPLGAYSETNTGNYAKLILYNGASFTVPSVTNTLGQVVDFETKIGRLETASSTLKAEMDSAVIDVGAGQTLTVENGINVGSSTALTKSGYGALQIAANGSGVISSPTSSGYTTINLGDVNVKMGTLRVIDGTANVEDVGMMVDTIALGTDTTLDIQSFDAIQLGGRSGDVVFSADAGSTINFYVASSEDYTRFVATTYNTYVDIGAATFNIESELPGTLAPESLTLFSTGDVGQTTYNPLDITITDNILGRNYVVDLLNSTSSSIVVTLEDSGDFADFAPDGNASRVAKSLDRLVDSGKYTPVEYAILAELESNMSRLNWDMAAGEIYASSVGFNYMNNLMTQQALFNNLRGNALVSYAESTASAVSPQDYDAGRVNFQQGGRQSASGYPVNYGSASNGAFDGPLYYNSDTNSYAPGVAPTPAIYNNESIGGYGDPNSYGMIPQFSTLRGQEAQYGDPGTLIYSAWAEVLGSSLQARRHKNALGYDGKQIGLLAGVDLFGSCDCRFGVYYGFQRNELDSLGTLGELETDEHQLGVYHQFGDENVYNIGTLHGGYGRYKTRRIATLLDSARELFSKHDTWNLGASFERGMNFKMQPLTISPYGQVEYNYFNRPKFTEQGDSDWAFRLHVKGGNYHSLRGQVGARIALDMYPGDQHVRIVGNAAYVHEFLDAMYGKTHANFVGLPTSTGFDVYGNSMGRDWALLGLGAEWAPIPALDVFGRLDYIVNKYTRNPGASAGLKYRW